MSRTHAANVVKLETTEETGSTGLTFTFVSTDDGPSVPCYASVALRDDERREFVKFTTKTSTTYQCASLDDRYLDGSVAESGITHGEGTTVRFGPLAQNLDDLWDGVEGKADDPHDNTAHSTNLVGEAGVIAALTEKETPHDDDLLVIEDSEDSNSVKKVKKSALGNGASHLAGYTEEVVTLGTSGTQTLDFAVANVWRIDPTGTVDFEFDNLPVSGSAAPGTLIIENDGEAVTWPVGTQHPDGEAPELDGETWLSIVAVGSTVTVGRAWGGVA